MMQQIATWLSTKFWIIEIMIIAATSYLIAKGTGSLILADLLSVPSDGYRDFPDRPRAAAQPDAVESLTARYSNDMGDPLLQRNIFDSTQGPIDRDAVKKNTDTEAHAALEDTTELVPCGADGVRLNSTVASNAAPTWSFASLTENGTRKLLHIGDSVGDKKIAWISWRYLFLQNETDICYIDIFGEDNLAGFPGARTAAHSRTPPLPRRNANKLLKTPASFAKKMRFRPKKKNGKMLGYELRRVPKRDGYNRLGLKKRDVIQKINGIALKNMDSLSDAYNRLRNADALHFSVLRKGKPVEVRIQLQ